MRKILFIFLIYNIFSILNISASELYPNSNIYYNPSYRFKIEKPKDWYFGNIESPIEGGKDLVYKNRNIDQFFKNNKQTLPLIIISKYQDNKNEPITYRFIPNLKVIVYYFGDITIKPEVFIDFLNVSMKKLEIDFDIIEKKYLIENNKNTLKIKYKYILKYSNNFEHKIITNLLIIQNGSLVFYIQTSSLVEEDNEKDFKFMMNSIKFGTISE